MSNRLGDEAPTPGAGLSGAILEAAPGGLGFILALAERTLMPMIKRPGAL